jgi:hypothetical protein
MRFVPASAKAFAHKVRSYVTPAFAHFGARLQPRCLSA